jgi:hypothetical protein
MRLVDLRSGAPPEPRQPMPVCKRSFVSLPWCQVVTGLVLTGLILEWLVACLSVLGIVTLPGSG